ncbi:hypothetical protein [Deinococcus yavapaiensis]|uniref:Outer membrane protein with beta-barrel domain n=1 Tax=Deinococcus yavapaiensis KR-236 TaxID=694435 RepID=A0A318S9P4_9DEIO|nr:hypothetical protein [Deinococcus yavapaiensis]PYE55860.1 hypothetical protein DES52_102226 [Deinococcus yavapaiensis KR-236]
MKRLLTISALLAATPSASAAFGWGSVNLTTNAATVNAGVALLPVPFIGTLGVEGGFERPTGTTANVLTVGATLRDVGVPLTDTDLFLGAGIVFSATPEPYLQGGLRANLIGPLGLTATVRAYPASRGFRAGLGAEIRF